MLWKIAVDGMRELSGAHPDLKFAIEYKPREPRVKMTWDSAARSLLGIEQIGLDNVGVLLDFGHSLYGGESQSDAAQLIIVAGCSALADAQERKDAMAAQRLVQDVLFGNAPHGRAAPGPILDASTPRTGSTASCRPAQSHRMSQPQSRKPSGAATPRPAWHRRTPSSGLPRRWSPDRRPRKPPRSCWRSRESGPRRSAGWLE
jgi:hypothetical protein